MEERIIAWDREETDQCEAGTYGCAVNHTAETKADHDDDSCAPW